MNTRTFYCTAPAPEAVEDMQQLGFDAVPWNGDNQVAVVNTELSAAQLQDKCYEAGIEIAVFEMEPTQEAYDKSLWVHETHCKAYTTCFGYDDSALNNLLGGIPWAQFQQKAAQLGWFWLSARGRWIKPTAEIAGTDNAIVLKWLLAEDAQHLEILAGKVRLALKGGKKMPELSC